MTKQAKGITLIALVITIIVLLILASITINLTLGDNGIFTKAKDARERTREANAVEKVKIEILASYDEDGKINLDLLNINLKRIEGLTHEGKTLDENPITSLPTEVELDGYKIEIDGEGKTTVSGKTNNSDENKEKTKITISPTEDETLTSTKEINVNVESKEEIKEITIKANISTKNVEEGIPSGLTLKNVSTEQEGNNKVNAIILIGRSK